MTHLDTRQINRDSLLLMAKVRVSGDDSAASLKVRNLSAGGMMAEGKLKVARGATVEVELRNLGWVAGRVAWMQGDRFGISFPEDIDPSEVRDAPRAGGFEDAGIIPRRPNYSETPSAAGKLRAI